MKRKRRSIHMRFRKNDPAHNLLAAVQHWVKARGGSLVVLGGIEVQDWFDGPGLFRVAVKCLGTSPKATKADA